MLTNVFLRYFVLQKEIGDVFDKWSNLSTCTEPYIIQPRYQQQPQLSQLTLCTKEFVAEKSNICSLKTCSLPNKTESRSFEKYLDAWSNNLLAEFATIIENEGQSQTSNGAIESADDDYDEVAGDSSDDDSMRMKYRVNQRDDFEVTLSSSPTLSPSISEHSSSGGSSTNGITRKTPLHLSRIVRSKQRSHVASVQNKCDPVLVNMRMYPAELNRMSKMHRTDYEMETSHHVSDKYTY